MPRAMKKHLIVETKVAPFALFKQEEAADMTEHVRSSRALISGARGAEVHPAVQSLHEAYCMNTEAQEAIKLLSAEIMEAYGLCRPLDNKMRCAEKQ